MLLYLDCFSGIAGDMLLAALHGCGARGLEGLAVLPPLARVEPVFRSCQERGLAAWRLEPCASGQDPGLPRRTWAGIRALLEEAPLPGRARQRALAVFQALAEAEARVHGCPPEEVHFHEVGAVDALVDVVGAALMLEDLGVDQVVCSPLPLGRGWVDCAHGALPLPGPAVCELLRGLPVRGEEVEHELVTPTGAALVRGLAAGFGPMPAMRMRAIGYGAGTRQRPDGRPNLLRAVLGEPLDLPEALEVQVLETGLDDWNPETWPHVSARLMEAGALDVFLCTGLGKKGRPAWLLRLVCDPAQAPALERVLFRETGTLGLRILRASRRVLPREPGRVRTPWGEVRVKIAQGPDGPRVSPEYEDCARLARERDIPLKDIYAAVAAAACTT